MLFSLFALNLFYVAQFKNVKSVNVFFYRRLAFWPE